MIKRKADAPAGFTARTETLTGLYKEFYRALVVYSMQFTADEAASQDIVQTVFQEMWEREVDLSHQSSVKAYLYNSVRNQSINHLRHLSVEADYVQRVVSSHEAFRLGADGSEEMFTEEIYRQLFRRIDQLPRRQREVFLLCMEGKTLQEIAAMLQISRETVKQRKRKGLDILREQLGKDELLVLLLLLVVDSPSMLD